jgi:predicted RNase H-like HicB family nuclease
MQFAGSPLFLWVDGQMVNMTLCQGVCYFYDEEDGWVVSFNMIDEFIFSQHGSEDEARQALLAVHTALNDRGYVVKVEDVPKSVPPSIELLPEPPPIEPEEKAAT